jgi:CheY-like chemotaxis protein
MLNQARILIVDDSPTILKVVGGILTRHGFEIATARDGLQGIERIRRGEVFDLVLLDFVMPRMNGYQFCRELRSDPELRMLPVVLMSAKGDRIRDHFVNQTGAVDAITKPFDARALVTVVEGALDRTAQGRNRPVPEGAMMPDEASIDVVEPPPHLPPSSEATREALAGDLAMIPVAEVMQLLQMQRQSGVLRVKNRDTERTVAISLKEGLIDLVLSAEAPAEEFRIGRYFVEAGAARREDIEQAAVSSRAGGRALGEELVRNGIVSEDARRNALEKQSTELVYDLLRWTNGRFWFIKERPLPGAEDAALKLPIPGVLLEGFRRVDEWRLMEGTIVFDAVLVVDDEKVGPVSEQLTRTDRLVIDAIDGKRTVNEILASAEVGSFDGVKVLYQLLKSGIVKQRSAG